MAKGVIVAGWFAATQSRAGGPRGYITRPVEGRGRPPDPPDRWWLQRPQAMMERREYDSA